MPRLWQIVGGLVVLAGLGLAAWTLWWVPPAGPPAEVVRPEPALVPPTDPLGQAIEARRPSLERCLAGWQQASPGAPSSVALRIHVGSDAEGRPSPEVQARGDAPGHLIVEDCATAALLDAGLPLGDTTIRLSLAD